MKRRGTKTPQGNCRGARKKRKQGAEVYVQEGKIDKRGVDDEARRDEWRGEERGETRHTSKLRDEQ